MINNVNKCSVLKTKKDDFRRILRFIFSIASLFTRYNPHDCVIKEKAFFEIQINYLYSVKVRVKHQFNLRQQSEASISISPYVWLVAATSKWRRCITPRFVANYLPIVTRTSTALWPLSRVFSATSRQRLFSRYGDKFTAKKWQCDVSAISPDSLVSRRGDAMFSVETSLWLV